MTESATGPRGRTEPGAIDGGWTLGRLKREYPALELALFAHFGVGSRERSGFSKDETLTDLMRRHLIFDVDRACRRLTELAREDRAWEMEPQELSRRGAGRRASDLGSQVGDHGFLAVDCRSREAFERNRLPGAVLLEGGLVARLQEQARRPEHKGAALVCCCQDGSQAPAASRHLRGLGFHAFHLKGGLQAWALEVDPHVPILYPDARAAEAPGRWSLLADDRTLRYRFGPHERPESGPEGCRWRLWTRGLSPALKEPQAWAELLLACPDLQTVALSPHSLSFVWNRPPGQAEVGGCAPWARADLWAEGGQASDPQLERRLLEEALAREAPAILGSHKGTVELADYTDRVAYLALGGGCAGCASAEITAQRELAGCLFRAVPLLDRIEART